MICQILHRITDSKDYISALSLIRQDDSLTVEEVDILLGIYEKYGDGVFDREYAKLCLSVDLLQWRTRENAAIFATLELGQDNLTALFLAKEIASATNELTTEQVDGVMSLMESEAVDQGEKMLLARIALDTMTGARNFVEIQSEIRILAEFLTGCSTEVLDRYIVLVGEVRMQCRK